MGRTVVLEVPDRLYETLKKVAGEVGQPFEQVAVEWLAVADQVLADDPLDDFIGALSSEGLDWADGHDRYLGESASHKMRAPGQDGGRDA